MAINQLAVSAPAGRFRSFRSLLTMTGVAGAGFALSWVAGLSIPAPNPALGASGTAILAAYAGHEGAAALSFALTEGLPAVGIAVITMALARAVGGTRGRVLRVAGLTAAVLSLVEFVLGMVLARAQDAGSAHLLWAAIDRIDGVKMLAFAVLGAAAWFKGTAVTSKDRWLRYTGAALAVTMTGSGLVYLLLVQSLNVAAGPALLFLLVFIAGTGIALGAKAR